ncbi:MAG: rbsK 1 [Mycobacterium sp.]|jgi:ribokinase|nr:rbsK 1 [Mycobacterium sp.]
MSRVCVVGSVNMDVVFEVTALPGPGETVLGTTARSVPGGKGGNQAIAAARAGAEVELVAAVGADAHGRDLREHLLENGIGLEGLVTLPGPSGTAAIVVDADGENMIVVAPGTNGHLTLDSPGLRDLVSAADVVLVQLEIPVATALVAARQARAAGAVVIVNASPAGGEPDRLAELAAVTDVVIVNDTEHRQWQWPVPHLVITRGARGALYVADGREFEVPAPAVEAVDTTGAGDVFAGVLAAGWSTDFHHALRRACAAGALATLVPGAGDCAPYDETIEDALARG